MSPYCYGALAIIGGLGLCLLVLVLLIAQAPSGEEDQSGFHEVRDE